MAKGQSESSRARRRAPAPTKEPSDAGARRAPRGSPAARETKAQQDERPAAPRAEHPRPRAERHRPRAEAAVASPRPGRPAGVPDAAAALEAGEAAGTAVTRSGRVALVGRPNVGKSTLLNAALGQPLAIVSPTPQTTRDAILGVVHHGGAELALLDTPGLHRPKTELGRVMNQAAREAARSADVVVFMTEVPRPAPGPAPTPRGRERAGRVERAPRLLTPHPGDVTLLADLGTDVPVVLVLNKVDRVRDKAQILPLLDAFSKLRPFSALVPISALRSNGVSRVLDEVAKLCPEGPFRFEPDEMTDRPARFFAAEYIREQILLATEAEVPHACAVQIERFLEPLEGGTLHIDATIHVERPGQKKILIGAAAEKLKRIGTQARRRIEELVGRQVNLKLWVRVTPDWRESMRQLEELGYGSKGEAS